MFLRMTKAFVRSGTMLLKVWNVFGIEQVSFEGREQDFPCFYGKLPLQKRRQVPNQDWGSTLVDFDDLLGNNFSEEQGNILRECCYDESSGFLV